MKEREIAFRLLLKIEKGAYANLILEETLRQQKNLEPQQRHLITELVYGTVKYRLKLDWPIDQLVHRKNKLAMGPRILLRLAFYQLFFLERIPPFAVVNETVNLAKKYYHSGIANLVNGLLRNFLRNPQQVVWPNPEMEPLKYLSVVYSHPLWMIQRWVERYGWENTRELCLFNNQPAELWIRTNTLKCTRKELLARLKAEGCLAVSGKLVPESILLKKSPVITTLPSFRAGWFFVQDETAQLISHWVDPQPGEIILDVCAAPGGKTTHLAQLMNNRGKIIACDLHPHRITLIEKNAARLGIEIIEPRVVDVTKLKNSLKGSFTKILLDAPCSGLGVLRRRPDARWRKKEASIKELALLQLNILENIVPFLAPGGKLIYSTCTLEPEENFQVIETFKKRYPQMASKQYKSKACQQFLPFLDTREGFFIARLQKEN